MTTEFTLLTVDALLTCAGALIVGVWVVHWLRRGRPDPLADAADRPNALVPEMLAIPVAVFIGVSMLLSYWGQAESDGAMSRTVQMNLGNAVQVAVLVACLWIAQRSVAGGVPSFLFGGRRVVSAPVQALSLTLMAIFGCAVFLFLTVRVLFLLYPTYGFPDHGTLEALTSEPSSTGARIALCVGAVFIAPIAEECFFRGLMQTVIVNVLRHRWSAIALTAGAFSLMHANQPHTVPALAALAIILGYAYEKSGSLVIPILIHMLFNLRTIFWHLLLNPVPSAG